MNVTKSSESLALADSLSQVVVIILESISIGLDDEVLGSSKLLSLATGGSSCSSYCCRRLCHVPLKERLEKVTFK